ncbi:MAG TPA: nucleoside-diphosphate kinase [Sporichthyaceae bacterium]|nr:nucleoside-diphosphate kinase [Sporichthyaceae bacterium]
MSENTLVLVKPDGVRRGLIGQIIARFEGKGFTVSALNMRMLDKQMADQHYAEHVEKGWYPELREFITSGPLVSMILSGDQAIDVVRLLVGATDGRKAAPGTVRGDFALSNQANLIHASDSPEAAAREIGLFFPDF